MFDFIDFEVNLDMRQDSSYVEVYGANSGWNGHGGARMLISTVDYHEARALYKDLGFLLTQCPEYDETQEEF